MGKKQTDSSACVTKQAAAILAFATFAIGFLGGAVFAVFKMPSPTMTASQPAQTEQGADRLKMAESLEAELAAAPDNVGAWIQLGHIYFDTGRHAEAIVAYEKALALKPGNADVITDLGIMYRRDGQPEKAVEAFDRAVEADPGHQNARFNKGIVLMHDLDDREGAIKVWEELLEINPLAMVGNGQSLDQLIDHYKKHGRQTPQ
jgi:cytochrome c-type biogenesis protein CcmH/NrfG